MTAPAITLDAAGRKTWTDAKGVQWVEYSDPLAPEPANPHSNVTGRNGYFTVDSTSEKE